MTLNARVDVLLARPRPGAITVEEALRLPTVITVEEAGRLLGLGRSAAYEAVARGELPTIRFGRRLLVPTARVLAMLGLDVSQGGTDAA
jgi:excisionase family DNA binding protein